MSNEQGALRLDKFHNHEVLDRLSLICAMLDEFILSHPYVLAHSDIEAAVIDGQANLARAYQLTGAKDE